MLLKNVTARPITVRMTNGEIYDINPGDHPAVEVPDDEIKSSKFAMLLIKEGMLKQEAAPIVFDDDDQDDELAQLQAEAIALGMEIKESWAASTLKGKIAKFKKENA